LDLRQKYDAYIVRDETVINSPSDGISIRNVEEGEKVGVGQIFGEKAKREKTKNDNFFSEDIKKLDQEIQEKLVLVIKKSNKNRRLSK